MNNPPIANFLYELRRRKVYSVAAGYFVVGWSIIQISSTVFGAWDMPRWALRLVMVLVLSGFPIALVLAWAFDLTRARAKIMGVADPKVANEPSSKLTRRNVLMVATLGILISLSAGVFLLSHPPGRKVEKSIAVLPFDNLSELKENAYFADGVQDDLLTSLAKVGDLKVISRTSVMSYRGNCRNIREVGKALGVGAVLEGSVRRSGNRVRVNVQLIDASNDEHIWAEDYDRDLTDVFAIQSELANEIASVLKAKLSPGEKAQIERKPTENAQAYLLYLQARDYVQRPDELMDDMLKAEQLFERAIQLDPSFALAHAQLSRLESWVYHANDPAPARLAKAKSAAGEALKLQPNLPEAHLALGYCAYYGDRDYARALQEFAIAQHGLPNNADIYAATAAIARRQGKSQQSIADSKKGGIARSKKCNRLGKSWHDLSCFKRLSGRGGYF